MPGIPLGNSRWLYLSVGKGFRLVSVTISAEKIPSIHILVWGNAVLHAQTEQLLSHID